MITLTYSSISIELPVHNYSPKETIFPNTIIKRSMTGVLYSHASPSDLTQLDFPLEKLDPNVARQLRSFIQQVVGKDIILNDNDNIKWRGKIINTLATGTDLERYGSNADLIFLGKKI